MHTGLKHFDRNIVKNNRRNDHAILKNLTTFTLSNNIFTY